MCNEEKVTIEVDFDEETLAIVEKLSEETGWSINKIVEYALANQIITNKIKEIKDRDFVASP